MASGNLFANIPASENGLSDFERGTSTTAFVPGHLLAQQRAGLPPKEKVFPQPIELACDEYPGDDGYAYHIDVLRKSVAGDKIRCPYISPEIADAICPPVKVQPTSLPTAGPPLCPLPAQFESVSKSWLSRALARLFFVYPGVHGITHADWLADGSFSEDDLARATLAALTKPNGFPSLPLAGRDSNPSKFPDDSWEPWIGTHQGYWFNATTAFYDPAIWHPPDLMAEVAKGVPPFTLQIVRWPNKDAGDWGWNQSRPDLPYLQGWDPKERMTVQYPGRRGTHLGHPFRLGLSHFILWLTRVEVFLEAVNPAAIQTFPATLPVPVAASKGEKRLPPTGSVSGPPKISTALSGRGQWVVTPTTQSDLDDRPPIPLPDRGPIPFD